MKQMSMFDEYVTITIKKPTRCGECPFYHISEFHIVCDFESHCSMGYMDEDDTRDVSYENSLYPFCKLGKEE